ncbi:energy transducer TonB [Aquimarina sp. D1M17]|uniref:energy transducer TonB n=1 Tax=Aquimarina acroporae TaxID=2937283 RepID=UPI0020C10BBD|nr:energy transducer TonB [Aquimarina acroporae]MCK8522437.1 energy transducer TonB [Aquimarina acroporae]
MSNKHDANVRKSPLVNFQIGLIASLLFTYVMFEVYTAAPIVKPPQQTVFEPEQNVWDGVYKMYEPPKEKVVAVKQSKPIVEPNKFKVIDDDTELTNAKEEFKNDPSTKKAPISPGDIDDVEPIDKPVEKVPFIAVEDVPVFPGCETLATNKEKAKCFSEKIARIISKKFNTDLGERYGLTGVQRIYALFEVGTDGLISNIQVRAPHPKLEKEAKRVIGLFPQMTPGKQRGTPVIVKYQLPIVFKIQS